MSFLQNSPDGRAKDSYECSSCASEISRLLSTVEADALEPQISPEPPQTLARACQTLYSTSVSIHSRLTTQEPHVSLTFDSWSD